MDKRKLLVILGRKILFFKEMSLWMLIHYGKKPYAIGFLLVYPLFISV